LDIKVLLTSRTFPLLIKLRNVNLCVTLGLHRAIFFATEIISIMKHIILFGALLFTSLLFSQESGTVAGTIMDKEVYNEPLIFADVRLKNTTKKVQTNFRGNFEITDVAPGSYTLEISYLGYEKLEIPVKVEQEGVTKITQVLSAKKLSIEDMSTLVTAKETSRVSVSKDSE